MMIIKRTPLDDMDNYYKFIVTYSFSDDDVRDSFTVLLEKYGFEQEPDQSTYSLDASKHITLGGLKLIINEWISSINDFDKGDVIVVYYPSKNVAGTFVRHVWKYDAKSRKLISIE